MSVSQATWETSRGSHKTLLSMTSWYLLMQTPQDAEAALKQGHSCLIEAMCSIRRFWGGPGSSCLHLIKQEGLKVELGGTGMQGTVSSPPLDRTMTGVAVGGRGARWKWGADRLGLWVHLKWQNNETNDQLTPFESVKSVIRNHICLYAWYFRHMFKIIHSVMDRPAHILMNLKYSLLTSEKWILSNLISKQLSL